MHGCIDGFSRRILWLKLTKSSNDPRIIGDFFLNAILERDGCPTLIRTERGTENGIIATVQCFLKRNDTDSQSGINAHRCRSSYSNQCIEAWWTYLRRSWSSWWIDFFKDMVDGGSLDLSDKLHCVSGFASANLFKMSQTKLKNTGIAITSGFQDIIHHLAFLIDYISCQKV